MTIKRSAIALLTVTLIAASCGSDDSSSQDTAAPVDTAAASITDAPPETGGSTDRSADPVTGPANISASDQSGNGTSVTVDAVELPTEGFVVIHADADGAPGPILGWSDLLPAGESTNVVITLNESVGASATVFPMAHVDANGNGEYEFMPPDVTIDVPAVTADGDVAVLSISYEISNGDEAAAASAAIELASTDLGEFIVDADGNSLYLFVPDSAGDSTCYDDCEAAWPILGEVADVGEGLDPALLGTTTRTNGDVQATYNGWPLYYFGSDAAPGDVNGQGVGEVWYVVDAAGQAIVT
jgi:predicted lipoprotein with Yx(FWY)xxD motif